MNARDTTSLLLLIAAVTGCSGEPDPVLCTGEVRPSIAVEVTDSLGSPISGAVLDYSVDGQSQVSCERGTTSFYCGSEEAGEFVIIASQGDRVAVGMMTVPEDECHVITQELRLTLVNE